MHTKSKIICFFGDKTMNSHGYVIYRLSLNIRHYSFCLLIFYNSGSILNHSKNASTPLVYCLVNAHV